MFIKRDVDSVLANLRTVVEQLYSVAEDNADKFASTQLKIERLTEEADEAANESARAERVARKLKELLS